MKLPSDMMISNTLRNWKFCPLRAFLFCLILNLLVIAPLLWLAGGFLPDRMDLFATTASDVTFQTGKIDEGVRFRARSIALSPGNFSQRTKMYFADGYNFGEIALGFGDRPAKFTIDKLTVMSRAMLMWTVDPSRFASCYESVGGIKAVANQSGGIDVEITSPGSYFKPRSNARDAWKFSLDTDPRLLRVVKLILLGEFILFLFCLFIEGLAPTIDNRSWRDEYGRSLSVAFLVSFLFLFVLPFQSYLVNRLSFPFTTGEFLAASLPRVLIYGTYIALVLHVLHYRLKWFPHVLLLSFATFEWLLTGVLSIGLPALNGEETSFWLQRMPWREPLEIYVAIVVFVIPLVFYRFISRRIALCSLVIGVMSGLSLFDVKVEQGADSERSDLVPHVDIVQSAFYSATNNIFVFILDAAPLNVCSKELDANPELRQLFPGFVQFRNCLSTGTFTSMGLPGIMTGIPFDENKFTSTGYERTIFGTNSFVSVSASRGFPTFFVPGLGNDGLCNIVRKKSATKGDSIDQRKAVYPFDSRTTIAPGMSLSEIVAYRLLPLRGKSTYLRLLVPGIDTRFRFSEEVVLYPMLARAPVRDDVPMTLHVYHTRGMHLEIFQGRNGERLAYPRNTLEGLHDVSYCILHRLGDLLKTFQDHGIYDNSLIIVCGDHGNDVASDVPIAGVPNQAFPLLMVKPRGTKDKAFSYDVDTPASLNKINQLVTAELDKGGLDIEQIKSIVSEKERRCRTGTDIWCIDETMSKAWRLGKE